MIIHRGYDGLEMCEPVVTMGIFDGVHLGHKVLISRLVTRARELKGESAVITFHPHPRIVLEKDSSSLTFLTTLEEKIALLGQTGIDHLIIVEFTREFSRIPACDFVKDILIGRIGAKHLIVGFNHHFGKRGEGDYETVRKCAGDYDFSVEQVEGLESEMGTISSSLVRESLLSGKVGEAAALLGYNYSLTGKVVVGRMIGRSLGFPTANINPGDPHKLIPANGVYAVETHVKNKPYPGMMSIGTNPTVAGDSAQRSIEVNVLGFSGDIYGDEIRVVFRKRLRDEKRFGSVEELKHQMELDRLTTLQLFS